LRHETSIPENRGFSDFPTRILRQRPQGKDFYEKEVLPRLVDHEREFFNPPIQQELALK
ncbi:MAG: hypothetical protein UX89_C0010G0032, partial [Parcubacteria group bacterium GW2011_GWA2_47_16]